MAIFNKKRNEDSPETPVNSEASTVSKPKKKKKDTMASILSESVIETSVEDAAKNKDFVVTKDGDTVYAAMLLAADDIGGINKKSGKDEAKGSIVEMINSGLIKTLITPQLMEDEKIVIIPDAMTLQAMDEFSLLTEAPYLLCYIHADGGVELTDRKITYRDMFDVLNNNISLDELTGISYEYEDEDYNDTPNDDEGEDIPIPEIPDDNIDSAFDEPDFDNVGNNDEMTDSDSLDFGDDDVPDFDDFSGEGQDESFGDFDELPPDTEPDNLDSEQASDDQDDESDIPDELVIGAIKRKFYSDDLGLEVTTEPFDSQFMHGNSYVPFDENRPDGWLNNHLNEMARAANVEMKRLHDSNLLKSRSFYFKLISGYCDTIQQQLDISDETTQFGKMYKSLRMSKAQAEMNIDRQVSARRAELEEDWNTKLAQVADDAARAAKQQYRERYGRQHTDDLNNVLSNCQDELEMSYQNGLRQLNSDRKAEASKRLDYGVNASLSEVANMYLELLNYEKEQYANFAAEMQSFVDNNRKDEIARSQALAEDLRQSQKADAVMAEYSEKIKAMQAEFDSKQSALKADLEKTERDNERRIQDNDKEWSKKLQASEKRNAELQAQVDSLLTRYAELDRNKKLEYDSRIAELQNERAALEDRCVHIENVHKRSSIISVFLIIAIAIATLAVGFIVGEYFNIKRDTNAQLSQIQSQSYVDSSQNNQAAATQVPQPSVPVQPDVQLNDNQTVTTETEAVNSNGAAESENKQTDEASDTANEDNTKTNAGESEAETKAVE